MRKELTTMGINREVGIAYDAIAPSYDEFYSAPRYKIEDRILYLDLMTHFIDQEVGHTKSILDVGCGTGNAWDYIGSWLGRHNYYGVDLSQVMIEKAIEKVGTSSTASFKTQDVRDHTGVHDVLFSMYGGFSYMPLVEVAKQISGLLRQGGRYYIVLFGQAYEPSDNVVVSEGASMVRSNYSEVMSVFGDPAYNLTVDEVAALHTEGSETQSDSKLLSAHRLEKNRGQFLVVNGCHI